MHSLSVPAPSIRCLKHLSRQLQALRGFATTNLHREEVLQSRLTQPPPEVLLDPNAAFAENNENPSRISGSRRRRAAIATSQNMPFEQLPYQCFQEARKILQADREEKLKQIETQKRRIALNQARDAALLGGEHIKKGKIMAMERHLEELKVLADVNDPMIKKLFEDGQGDMNRPIYRYLADKKWREFKRKLMMQRLTQMHVVPDLLPHLDPVADISFTFGQHHVQPGAFVNSAISERVPKLTLQVFDKGPRLVTIAVVDPDVPNLETDGFDFRCHYLAPNIQLDPTNPHIYLSRLKDNEVILPWLPPHALKGSPYHRLAIFVLQQEEGKRIDVPTAQQREKSLGFNLRSFMTRYSAKPVTATMFRNVWDDSTMGVMERAGLEGANIELKRKRGEKLPYKKKDGSRYR